MSRLTWSKPDERFFETGLDRGVLYPKNGPAVAWNGLTSVDENGADENTAYYLEGRPFLFLPKPKEFRATLKAYTYPDEFSVIMGLPEAADGMYIDSQMGESFDLCYRTLVGNAVEGQEHGYKIHLVYNATVAPQALSYSPVGQDVNPTEFSWDIQTVPVRINGYRASAHVVLDTRHIDSITLDKVEAALYGSDTVVAALPDPQTVIEMLSFGEDVVITDLGDGLWAAQGSYRNVYEGVEEGTYEIVTPNVLIYDNGLFEISSDPIVYGVRETLTEPLNP